MEGENIIARLNEELRSYKAEIEKDNRILVVDDEDVVLMVLEELLLGEGYQTALAKTGEESMEQLRKSPFKLVVTDKNLPGISGLDVLRQCKELNPLIEVLMITGYASLESALEAIGLGAYDYLTKPFDNLDILRVKIRKAMSKQKRTLINRKVVNELKKLTGEFMQRSGGKEAHRHIIGKFAAELERFKQEMGKKNKILVIDHDEEIGGVTTRCLAEQGYDATYKPSGEEGIDFLREHGANLIITDKDLPGIDGFALIEQAKQTDSEVEIMMIASGSSLDTVLKAVDKGACDYLLKPLEGLNVLLTKVKKALREQNDNLRYKKLIQELKGLSKEALQFAREAERKKNFFEELTDDEAELLDGLGAGPPRSPEEIEADRPIVIKVEPKESREKFEQFMEEVKEEPRAEERPAELRPEAAELKPEPEPAELKPEPAPAELKPETAPAELRPEAAELKPEPAPAEIKPEPAELRPQAAELKPEAAELKPEPAPAEIKPEPAPAELRPEAVVEEKLGRTRVLVVDDEEVVLQVMEELLTNEGYEVELALSGEQGLGLLTDKSFDLMLIDKNLPGISGLDLIGSAKKIDPEMEFIMMTAYGSLQSARMAMELGVCSYILKPLDDVKDISQVVSWATHKRREKVKLKKAVEQLQEENQFLKQELTELKKKFNLDA